MGFSSITGDETIMFADNASFDGTQRGGKMTTDGQLFIGSSTAPHVRKGTLTSISNTVNITPGHGTINLETGAAVATIYTADAGSATPAANTLSVVGSGGITTSGAGSTLTITAGTTLPTSFSTDSGTATPSANVISIKGLSGSNTSGSGSTVTVKSPPFSQVGSSATSSLNTGEFVTAAVTRTLPASAGLADGDLFVYVATTAGALVIQAVSAQKIRIGNGISSAAGTATSTAIGDSLSLRFNATDGFFYATSVVGSWTLA